MLYSSRCRLVVGFVLVLALATGSVWALHANEGAELTIADTGGVKLGLKGSILGVQGEAREYVYAGSAQNEVASDYKVSELIWDIKSLAMAGGTLSLQVGEMLRINAGAWTAINKGSGGMEDYDWFVPGMDWTHFSESEVDIESAVIFDVNASLNLFDIGPFAVSGLVGYKHDFWEWSDFGGSYIYSSDPPSRYRDVVDTFGGANGIDYEQTFDIPYLGVQVATEGSAVRASAYVLYSPAVKAEDKDHHIFRDLYFREEFDGGDYMAVGADLSIDLTESIFISGSVDVQVIPEFTGDMYQKEGPDGQESMTPDGAGIENTVAAVAISAGIRL